MALLSDREAQDWIDRALNAEAENKQLLSGYGELRLDYVELADGIEAREDELARLRAEVELWHQERDDYRTEARHLRRVMAAALERTQVADDPSGAAEEATAILEAEVKLDGSPADKDSNDASTG